jgi:hypothetical protein
MLQPVLVPYEFTRGTVFQTYEGGFVKQSVGSLDPDSLLGRFESGELVA